MLDFSASELLLVVIVAVVVIGPKDLPMAMRTAGRWVAKMRRISSHFRAGVDAMIREAELEEMDREWKARNAAIMAAHPDAHEMEPLPVPDGASAEGAMQGDEGAGGAVAARDAQSGNGAEPQLPLPPP